MEYRITAKPITSGNPTSNTKLEQLHRVIINLVRTCNITQTYADEDYQWSGILAASEFAIQTTTKMLKGYSTSQFLFGCDMTLPIKNKVDW